MWQYIKSREFWLASGGIAIFFALLFVVFFWLFLPMYTRHNAAVTVPDLSKLILDEAVAELNKQGLDYEVSDSVFFPTLKPLAVMNQDPPALSKVKPGRKIYLTVNKQTAPLVKVPEVLHVSLYQARVRLDNWGLGVGSVSSRPSDLKDVVLEVRYAGKVVKPGEQVQVGTRLDLVIGKGLDDAKVELPDLKGLPYSSAMLRLQELGLMAGEIRFKPDAPEEPGTVIRQDPPFSEGDSVAVGTEFILFISGEEPEIAPEVDQDSTF